MPDFRSLTPAQQQALLLCTSRTVSTTVEVLGLDLSVSRTLTGRLDPSQSSVQWDGPSTVHRGCTLTLLLADGDVDWSQNLVRLSMTLTDDVTGLSGSARLGVFALARPDRNAGTVVEDQTAGALTSYTVTGQDVTSHLDRLVGYSYVAPAKDGSSNPVGVLATVAQVSAAAGFPAGSLSLIDSTAAASVMSQDMTWPWIAPPAASSANDTSAAPVQPMDAAAAAGSGPATWREVLNDVLGQVGYWAAWADESGLVRFTPYVAPGSAPVEFVFDVGQSAADAAGNTVRMASPLMPPRTRSLNVGGFNQATYIWSNMPADASGNAVVASAANGGVVTYTNSSSGPSSIAARGGTPRGVWPTQVQITAASLADFTSQAQAQFAALQRVVTTHKVSTVPYLAAGHYNVFTYVDPVNVAGGSARVQATSWSMPLDGSPMTWTFQEV